jgi:glycosyltransferase involved in cell wall biosynthesis
MSGPELSVVVPSVNGYADLRDCLTALEQNNPGVRVEIIVVERCGEPVRGEVRRAFPAARLINVDPSVTIPAMRALAFAAATAPAVAVIEDHVIVPPGWARQMIAAIGGADRIVGGAVENAATGTVLDWAAFLCEYSHCLPPLPAGEAEWLTGNNVTYPRALLDRYRAVVAEGRWENVLHDAMRRDGVPLVCHPEIVVGHKKHYTFGEYLSQRYLYARSYAGARVSGAPVAKRAAYGLAAFVLPPLLFYRTVNRILKKGRHQNWLLKSLPLIAVFVVAWGAGEVVGYWAGAGDSLGRVC